MDNSAILSDLVSELEKMGQYRLADNVRKAIKCGQPNQEDMAYITRNDLTCLEEVKIALERFEKTAEEIYYSLSTLKARVEPLTPESTVEYKKAVDLFESQVWENARNFNLVFMNIFSERPFDLSHHY